jgi:hypothetical protein
MNGAVGEAAQRVTRSVQRAADQVQVTASKAQDGVSGVQGMIRARPIAAILVASALGYLLGRTTH